MMDEAIEIIRERMDEWLSQPVEATRKLERWLRGYDLPPRNHDEEPYILLLQALPSGAERSRYSQALAQQVAFLFEEQPDATRPILSRFLYNLLLLAAGLGSPDELAVPLLSALERRQLDGSYLGVELRELLATALIPNQRDSTLEPVWQMMLETGGHPFLGGNEYIGYEGLLYMPTESSACGIPGLSKVGHGLRVLADYLTDVSDRERQFLLLLDRLYEAYPTMWSRGRLLLKMAQDSHWPAWAAWCFDPVVRLGARPLMLLDPAINLLGEDGTAESPETRETWDLLYRWPVEGHNPPPLLHADLRGIGLMASQTRRALGLNRVELAIRAGLNPWYLAALENGQLPGTSFPLPVLARLSVALRRPIRDWPASFDADHGSTWDHWDLKADTIQFQPGVHFIENLLRLTQDALDVPLVRSSGSPVVQPPLSLPLPVVDFHHAGRHLRLLRAHAASTAFLSTWVVEFLVREVPTNKPAVGILVTLSRSINDPLRTMTDDVGRAVFNGVEIIDLFGFAISLG